MSIKDELLAIQASNPDGLLLVREAHEWAKANPDSELHKRIEWDVDEAALQYQFMQIRRLIKLHIVTTYQEPEIRSLSIDRINPGGGYRLLSDIMAVPDLRKVALADALRELELVQDKYKHITDLAEVWTAVKTVRERAEQTMPSATLPSCDQHNPAQ